MLNLRPSLLLTLGLLTISSFASADEGKKLIKTFEWGTITTHKIELWQTGTKKYEKNVRPVYQLHAPKSGEWSEKYDIVNWPNVQEKGKYFRVAMTTPGGRAQQYIVTGEPQDGEKMFGRLNAQPYRAVRFGLERYLYTTSCKDCSSVLKAGSGNVMLGYRAPHLFTLRNVVNGSLERPGFRSEIETSSSLYQVRDYGIFKGGDRMGPLGEIKPKADLRARVLRGTAGK